MTLIGKTGLDRAIRHAESGQEQLLAVADAPQDNVAMRAGTVQGAEVTAQRPTLATAGGGEFFRRDAAVKEFVDIVSGPFGGRIIEGATMKAQPPTADSACARP